MNLADRDRLTEQERLINEILDQIAGLPAQLAASPFRPINIVTGQVVGAVAGTSPYNIDQILVRHGNVPAGVSESSSHTISVVNAFSQILSDNDLVIAFQRDDTQEWVGFTPVGSSAARVQVFRATASKSLSAADTTGKPINASGATDAGASQVRLVDQPDNKRHVLKGPYTDHGGSPNYDGYWVVGLHFTDDYDSTGDAGYWILAAETPMRTLLVTLTADYSASGTGATIDSAYGRPNMCRLPATVSGTVDVTIAGGASGDPKAIAAQAKSGEAWEVQYDEENDQYIWWERAAANPGERFIGTVNGDVTSSGTQTDKIDAVVELIEGPTPTPPVSFENSQPELDVPDDQDIEVQLSRSDNKYYPSGINVPWIMRAWPGWDETKNLVLMWKTSGGNATPEWVEIDDMLNLLAGHVAGNDQSIGHDASGDTEWQDDDTCS